MKKEPLFTITFAVITLSEMYADLAEMPALVYLFKPLIVLSLILYSFRENKLNSQQQRWLVTGLVCALAGDVFLMIRSVDFFIPGLASFLLMQICYIIVFRKQITVSIFSTRALATGLPFLVCACSLYLILFNKLPDSIMQIAVAIYALSIAVMAWLAVLRKPFGSSKSYVYVFVGAVLFMISDSCIAIDKFLFDIPFRTVWIMGTYAAAQYLIVTGLQKTKQTD
ncbi:MAG TPA: lysoplasmalogenase [Dyadobacter sp.]|nr:lysoplasmalogenase [Dyadobacter sp.]